jgi:hypothetical protein
LKRWASSWCLSHFIPPTSHRATLSVRLPETALGRKAFHQGRPGDCCGQ